MTRSALLPLLILFGCTTNEGAPRSASEPPRTVGFVCEGSERISVTFGSANASLTGRNGKITVLNQRPAASGFWYEADGETIRGKGRALTWTRGKDTVTCSEADAERDAAASLAGTRWQLVRFQSSDDAIGTITPADPSLYTLELLDGGRIAMRLDCNRGMAGWSTYGPSGIRFTPGAMTRAACPQGSMDTRIARDLGRIRSFTLAGDTINFALEADGGIYTWRRLP